MWCPTCRADVAAEVLPDNRHAHCATCGSEILAPPPGGSTPFPTPIKTREARELLDRWAAARSEQSATIAREQPIKPPHQGGVNLEETRTEPASAAPSFRFDSAHPGVRAATRDTVDAHATTLRQPPNARRWPEDHELPRLDDSHDFDVPNPHFDHDDLLIAGGKRTNWSTLLGQLLAYVGVALLTVGSSLVLWSYFGGPADYAPTGWLTTTAGQMLLFLGVVTLVAGGIEQSSDEVKLRIERLGERMIRIERYSRDHALRGPKLPVQSFGDGGPTPTESRLARHTERLR